MNDKPKRLELTADELKAVERAKAEHAKLKARGDYEQYKIYSSPADGVKDLLKGMATTKYYDISSFYKPELVTQALKNLEVPDKIQYPIAGGGVGEVNTKELKQKLTNHIDKLVGFYSNFEGGKLSEKTSKLLDKKTVESLSSYFELKTVAPKDKDGKSVTITGYAMTDITALKTAIAEAKPKSYKTYEIVSDPAGSVGLGDMFAFMRQLVKLAHDCGIDDGNNMVMGIGEIAVTQTHLELMAIINKTLANVRTKRASTRYANIRGDEVGIPRDVIEAGDEGMTQVKENPSLLGSLDTVYRTEQERAETGGLALQTDLFKGLLNGSTDTDIAPWASVEQAIRALNIAGTTALVTCMRYLHDNPNGGDITIDDLMLHDHKRREQKNKWGSIAKTDKKAFADSLKLLLALNWAIKTRRNDRTSTIKYYRLINGEIDIDNETGEILMVRGLRFDNDFYDIQHKLLHVIAPKGIDYLISPEAKKVALKVQSRFVKEQGRTVKGEPITVTREWLAKGSYGLNKRTNEIITKLLDDMVTHNLIAKWHTKNGKQALSGYDKDTYTILLYPTTDTQGGYITKEARLAEAKAERQAKKDRVTNLKKVIRSYNNDDELAQELGVSVEQLNLWASEAETIPESKADKVKGLV
jgi:hypothetical protein